MSEESKNWIKEAKEYFDGFKSKFIKYEEGDPEKSKKYKQKLKELLETNLTDSDVILNIQGNKWGMQGHKKLKNSIWYKAFHKNMTKNYPLVLNFTIDKNGLNISIDIHEAKLKDDELKSLLLNILKQTINDKQECKEKTHNMCWEDDNYGYFGLDDWDNDKIRDVIDRYKNIVCEVNKAIFNKMIENYKNVVQNPTKENIFEGEGEVQGLKNTALEYQMEEDNFPLINGGIENAVNIIEKNICMHFENNKNILDKMRYFKSTYFEDIKSEKIKEKYYLLDQFLNLIDKIKYEDIKKVDNDNKELYPLAYLFTFFRRKKNK